MVKMTKKTSHVIINKLQLGPSVTQLACLFVCFVLGLLFFHCHRILNQKIKIGL